MFNRLCQPRTARPSLPSLLFESCHPQAAAFDIKLSHSRTSAKVSMANQAAEMEATVAKRIEAKVGSRMFDSLTHCRRRAPRRSFAHDTDPDPTTAGGDCHW